MGTNYYLMTTNKELAKKYFPNEFELVDSPYFGYEIHIAKRSLGWKVLYQGHRKAYASVEGLKNFIRKHQKDIRIFDEYKEEFTLLQLDDELFERDKRIEKIPVKFVPQGIPNKIFGGKDYFVEGTWDDYDLTRPYDHLEYSELDPYSKKYHEYKNFYYHDKDGYDFTDREFC